MQAWDNLRFLIQARLASLSENPFTIRWLVDNLDKFEATDPRDRGFAITGLVSPADVEEEDFQPNYEIRVEELYTQVTRRLIRDEGVQTLYRAGVGVPRSLCLPSWVPDWTSKRACHHLYGPATMKGPHYAGGMKLRVDFSPESSRVAILHGCIMDTVWRLGHVKGAYLRTPPWREIHEAERQWIVLSFGAYNQLYSCNRLFHCMLR